MIHPDIAFYALFSRDNSKVKRGGEWQERKTPKFRLRCGSPWIAHQAC